MWQKIILLLVSDVLFFVICAQAEITYHINKILRQYHSRSYLRKMKPQCFLNRLFYRDFRKGIPIFWYVYNIFIKSYILLYPLIGLLFLSSEESFRSYMMIVFFPFLLFSIFVWLFSEIVK